MWDGGVEGENKGLKDRRTVEAYIDPREGEKAETMAMFRHGH
jgi:hypothetical protein